MKKFSKLKTKAQRKKDKSRRKQDVSEIVKQFVEIQALAETYFGNNEQKPSQNR